MTTTQPQTLIPQLRFPEFGGEWVEKKLGEVFKFKQGVQTAVEEQHDTKEQSMVRFIRIVDVTQPNETEYRYIQNPGNEHLIQNNDLFMIRYGTPGVVSIGFTGVIANNLFRLIPEEDIVSKFFYYFFKKNEGVIYRLSSSSSMPAISFKTLDYLKVNKPMLVEQTKIAEFLSVVDDKIGLLEQKRDKADEYKRGLMQRLFAVGDPDSDYTPLRFPGYADPWQEKKLGEMLDYEQPTKYLVEDTEYDNKYATPVLTAGKTFLLGYTNESDGIFSQGPVIIFDDFTTATQYVDFDFKVKSSALKILKPKGSVNIKLVYEIMKGINYEIGGHQRHWISLFADMKIKLPATQEEQQEIADLLSSVDYKIDALDEQITQAKEFKKGLLQQMLV